jgi:hypothetical protein
MKPLSALIAAAALTLGASVAMAQSGSGAMTNPSATKSEQNPSVGDGSSGGPNAGAQSKVPNAPANAGADATVNTAGAKASAGAEAQKEGKTGDAVTTTGSGETNQKKQ